MRSVRVSWCVALVVSVACMAMLGCSKLGMGEKKTGGEKRTEATVGGLKETRAELASGKTQINKTVASMNAMRDGQGDLKAEFATFNDDIKRTDSHAAKTRSRANDMKARAAEYQKKWREEMANVEDPTLRQAAEARAAKVKERYDSIAAKAAEARAAYDPFMKQLKSVQTYLSNDLTPVGIQGAAPVFDKATADSKDVLAKIDAVIAELDEVAATMSTIAPPAPAPAPAPAAK